MSPSPSESITDIRETFEIAFLLDERLRIRESIGPVESVLGYSPTWLIHTPIETLLAVTPAESMPVDAVPVETFRSRLSDGGATLRLPFVCKNGMPKPVEVTAISLEDRKGICCGIEPIDADHAVSGTFATLAETVSDPMYIFDDEGTIKWINEAMADKTGYTFRELFGRNVAEITPLGETEEDHGHVADLIEPSDADSTVYETALITKDNEAIYCESRLTFLENERGEYLGSVALLRDIDARKQREQELSLFKTVLSRLFRHNLRNELNVVQSHAELLADGTDAEMAGHVRAILENTDRLLGHSEKIRIIEAVISTDSLSTVDLATVVERVLRSYEGDTELTLDADIPDTAIVAAHPHIREAIDELLANAIEHAPEGERPHVKLWIDEQETQTTLFVEDKSGGLTEQEITVLQRGTERKLEHSSGIGLWLIRWLVEYSDAELVVHQATEGTLMGIQFGRTAAESDTARESPTSRVPSHVLSVHSADTGRDETIVGRIDELNEFKGAYSTLREKGAHTVLVSGPAGIGKTTLVTEFLEWVTKADGSMCVATGACSSNVTRPYGVIRQVLADLPGETDPSALFEQHSYPAEDDTQMAHRRRQSLFADLADEIRSVVIEQPSVFVFEDVHWAERETIDLLEYLVDEIGQWGLPVMFIVTSRPGALEEGSPARPLTSRIQDTERGTLLKLDPLSEAEIRRYLDYVFDAEPVSRSFAEAVHEHTSGDPLFVTETIRKLADGAVGSAKPDRLAEFDDSAVPGSIEEAITERLVGLPSSTQSVLELGAIVGKTVPFDVLHAASDLSEKALLECAELLIENGLWRRNRRRFSFSHDVIRKRVLERIADTRKRELHARVAAAIESVTGDDLHRDYSQLATHYREGHEPEKAFECYEKAAAAASKIYAHKRALESYQQAAQIAREHDGSDAKLGEIRADIATVFYLLGEFESARDVTREELDNAADGSRVHCRLLALLARLSIETGEFDTAQETAQELRRLAETGEHREFEGEASQLLGIVARRRGQYETAREYHRNSVTVAEDGTQFEADAHKELGIDELKTGNNERARDLFETSLRLYETLGDRHGEAEALNNLGMVTWDLDKLDNAYQYHLRALEITEEIADEHYRAKVLNNLGLVERMRGNLETARGYARDALDVFETTGDRHSEAKCLGNLGLLARYSGEFERAEKYHRRSLELFRELGDRHGEAKSLDNLGIAIRQRGDLETARSYHERSLRIKAELNDTLGEAACYNNLGFVARVEGDLQQAEEHHRRALDIYRDHGSVEGINKSLGWLGLISVQRGETERGRKAIEQALSKLRSIDATTVAATLRTEHIKTELALEHEEHAIELCEQETTFTDHMSSDWHLQRQLEQHCGTNADSEHSGT